MTLATPPEGTTAWIADCSCGDRYVAGHFGLAPRTAGEILARRRGCDRLDWRPVDTVPADATVRTLVSLGAILPVEVIRSAGRSAWVDCIAWIRDAPPPSAAAYDVRVDEAYFPGEARDAGEAGDAGDGGNAGEGILEGAPLIALAPPRRGGTSRAVVLSLGGVHSQALAPADLSVALDVMLTAAGRAFARVADATGTLLLPSDLIPTARAHPEAGSLQLEPVAPGAFHAHLATAGGAIVQPGLAGPFEAFAAGVPTAITLPFTWTQLHQTLEFERRGLHEPSTLAARYLAPFRQASRRVDDEPAITSALGEAQRALTDSDLDEYADELTAFVEALPEHPLTAHRQAFVLDRLRLPDIASLVGPH